MEDVITDQMEEKIKKAYESNLSLEEQIRVKELSYEKSFYAKDSPEVKEILKKMEEIKKPRIKEFRRILKDEIFSKEQWNQFIEIEKANKKK